MESRASSVSAGGSFARGAGLVSMLVGVGGLVYSVAFVLAEANDSAPARFAAALLLLLTSLAVTAVLVAIYDRVRVAAPTLALWALVIGVVAALGGAIHGGFDLANELHDPRVRLGDLPNGVDPRGLLTFGVAAVSTFVFGWLIRRSGVMSRSLGTLGMALAVLLFALYLGRLIIFDAKNPLVLGLAVVTGFVIDPIWWIWLGVDLRRRAVAETG